VEGRAQRGLAVAVGSPEDAGVVPDLRDRVVADVDRRGRVVLWMDVDRRTCGPVSSALDVRVVVDTALNHRVVDPEDVDDRAAATLDQTVAVDVEVLMGGVL